MPLGVVKASGPGTKSVFEKLNPFVDKLVTIYKKKKQDENDNEWISTLLLDIENPGSKKSIEDAISKKDPPIDLEGITDFANEAVNLLTKKEIATGGLTPTTPQATEEVEQTGETEPLPDVKEFSELFQFVSEIPTGNDWTNTKALYKKKLESGRAIGALGKSILTMIMGEGQVDQRQKFEQDFDLAAKMKQELYPETEEEGVVFDPEQFKRDNPDMYISGYNSNTGGYTFKRKDEEEEGKLPTSDRGLYLTNKEVWQQYHDDLNAVKPQPTNDPNYQIVTITDKEGVKTSYYVNKDDPDAQATPVKGLPQGQGTTPSGGTKKIIPTYGVIQTISNDLLDPGKDYDTVMAQANLKYDFSDPSINLPTKADQAQRAYSLFEQIIYDEDNNFIDEKGFVKNPEGYADYYEDYEKFTKTYYNETGQVLPKKYLSLEEAGKYTSLTWGTGEKGGYKPVKNTENIPWSWQGSQDKTQEVYNQMIKEGLTIEDMNLEELSKDGVDINKLLQMFNQ